MSAPTPSAEPAAEGATDLVPVAIVGCGRVARYHLAAVEQHARRCRLVAVVDPEAARAGALLDGRDVPVFADDAAMLAAVRPGLVCVCTPPGTHAAIAERALEAGAWAYVEKPLCAGAGELRRLVAAEARTGRRVAGVVQWRAGHAAKVAKTLVDAGDLGRPLSAAANTTWYRDAAYFEPAWRGTWAGELGGTTMSHAIHTLDLLLHLAGGWEEVTALAATAARDIEVEDVSAAAVRLSGGGLASVLCSCLSPKQASYLRVDYEHATLELKHFTFYRNADWTLTPAPGHEPLSRKWKDALAERETPPTQGSQLGEVLSALRDGGEPPVTLAEAGRTLGLIEAIYESARTGQRVTPG